MIAYIKKTPQTNLYQAAAVRLYILHVFVCSQFHFPSEIFSASLPPSFPALEVGNIVSPLSTIRHDLIEMENFSQMIKLLAFYVHL